MERVTIKIDGRGIATSPGRTILDAAEENGIRIPTLCHLKGLTDVGACRVCIVDVRGQFVTACTTNVAEGMEILTDTEAVRAHRRMIVELLFAEGNHVCSFCVSSGGCELQDLACEVGMQSVRIPYAFPRNRVDASHPRFLIDRDRCVVCGRCVRACGEIEGARTWDFAERGSAVRVITDLDVDWGQAETCTGCGKCVDVCPRAILEVPGPKGKKVKVVDGKLPECSMCKLCEKVCLESGIGDEPAITISAEADRYIFVVEGDGSLPTKEIMVQALSYIREQANELEKQTSEISGEEKK